MTVIRPQVRVRLRRRLTLTAVLVLIALGGAGLATASDRPATDRTRPELTAHTDALAQPWIESMASQAHAVADRVDTLNESGRTVLGLLQGLDPSTIDNALAAGDQQSADLEVAAGSLADQRYQAPTGVDEQRLSHANKELLVSIDTILQAALPMPATWQSVSSDTRQVTTLLVALLGHDGLIFRATGAGRQDDWPSALDLIDQAKASLAAARGVRDQLAETNDVATLDELLGRYDTYDTALAALYTGLRNGLSPDGQQAKALKSDVDRAEAGLPQNTDALKVIVAEASESSVTDGVVALEQARGMVDEAVAVLP